MRQLNHSASLFSSKSKRTLLLASIAAFTVASQWTLGATSTIQLTASDGFGGNSFAAGGNWGAGSNGSVPTAGTAPTSGAGVGDFYDYYVHSFRQMRTAASATFGGDALTLMNGGMFFNKAPAGALFTVNNLTLDAGILANSGGGTYTMNGAINLTNNGGLVWSSNTSLTTVVNSNISGAGSFVIGGGTASAGVGETTTIGGNNTYTGNTSFLGHRLVLASANALPSTTVLTMGSNPVFATDGNAVMDMAGFSPTIAGLQVASFTAASATGSVSGVFGSPAFNGWIHMNSMPANIAPGQKISTSSGTGYILLIDKTRNDIFISQGTGSGTSGPISSGTNVTFTFGTNAPTAASQIIGNSSTTTDSILTIKGPNTTTFAGTIQNVLGGGTRTAGVTVAGGTFTLTGANTYSNLTSINGGALNLDFSATGAPVNHIINSTGNNSGLAVNGGALNITGSAAAANTQRFNNTTINGGGKITLTRNGQDLSTTLGAITRNKGGVVDFTNPTGTLSATNSIQTTSGAASTVLTDASGTPYATVGGTTWAQKDASNTWIEGMPAGSFTASTASSLSGNADVASGVDTTLAGSTSITTLRFNQAEARSINLGGNTLTVGGILNTSTVGGNASSISGGSLNGNSGGDLVAINNASGVLSIGANLVDNAASGFTAAGTGTVALSGTNNYTGSTYASGGTLAVTKQVSLYNNTPASWTASNIVVGTSGTLALNVGGAGEFSASDVATIAALGSATGGFKSGSTLALDTSNAGGSFSLSSAITNTNSNANEVNLKKLGSGTLVLTGSNSYTGSTTINSGALQLGATGTLTGNSRVAINNATLDLNNHSTTISGLSGSGTIGLGTGTLTVTTPNNTSFDGAITGTGGLTVNGGGSMNLTGTSSYNGTTTVRSGTLSLSSTSSANIGDSTHPVLIGNGNGDTGVLNIGSGVTLTAGTGSGVTGMFVAGADNSNGTGGRGTVNQTGGTVNATQITIGSGHIVANGGTGTYNLSGGTINMSGNIRLAVNNNSTGTLNISGGAINMNSNTSITSGQFFSRPGTVNQTGGTVTFYSDAGTTIGGTGALDFLGGSSTSAYNLSGGTMTVPSITRSATSGTPSFNFNGGTIRPAVANPAQFIATTITTRVMAGGAVIDTNGNDLTMNNVLAHDTGLGSTADGGLTKNGAGTLTLTGASTYTGNTTINTGKLSIGSGGSVATSANLIVNSGATLDVSAVAPFSLGSSQTLRGTGTVAGSVNHSAGTITGATVGTGGILSFSDPLTLAGGATRFDLDTTSGSSNNDRINANGGLSTSAGSLINVQFATLPSTAQTYVLFNYTGTLGGSTGDFILGGNAGGRSASLNFATPGQVKLTFTPGGAAAALVWKSSSSQAWDIQTTANWKNVTQSIASDVFYNGDNITLTDNSIDSSVPTNVQTALTLNAVAAPNSITYNSSVKDYSVSGTGKISGSTGITKNGTGTLTLSTNNDFTGTTNINAGKIIVTDTSVTTSTSGLGTGAINIASGATLQVGDGATSGAGTVVGNIANSGTLVINRPDSYTLNSNVSGAGILNKESTGTVTLSKIKHTYTGTTNINGGTITSPTANDLPDTTIYNIANTAGATLDLGNVAQNVKGISGGGASGGLVSIGTGTLTLNGGTTNTFAGQVTGNAVIVTGGSTQSFTGDPQWTGNTNVQTGTLSISSTTSNITGSLSSTISVGTNNLEVGVLNIGTGALVGANLIQAGYSNGNGTNGIGTINQTGGLVLTNGLRLGGVQSVAGQATGTYNLSGGELHQAGAWEMGWNNNSAGFLNVSGTGHLYVGFDNDIRLGRFFSRPAVVTMTGGTISFMSDEATTYGTTGGILLGGGSTGGNYGVNLNGGLLEMAGAKIDTSADRSGYFHFGGGTLKALSTNSDYFPQGGGGGWSVNIGTGGGTIDTNGFDVGINQVVAHDTTLGATPDGGLTKTGGGTLTLAVKPTYTGNTTANAGKLMLSGGAVQGSGNMSITNGALIEVAANGGVNGVTVIKNLTTTGTGSNVQIHDNDMVLDYGAGPSSYTSVVNQVKSGLTILGGAGTDGITSAEVDAQTLQGTMLAVVDDGDANIGGAITATSGYTLVSPTSSVIVKYTWFGDSNLDGAVDGSDYALLDSGFTSGGTLGGWVFGDYDYSGSVDGSDYALIDTGFISQNAVLPEPTTLGVLGLGAVGMLRRRRRA